ncbi:acyl-CoA dehydrogenase family protein [Haloechinothrix salitolerans]|uniref:Acyl-CoA dehydrogenase family protein n=1 Tax=Haloechinothrix salitolerans TaxID=926830 RepID=A0ABW2BWD3_9PSEU
MTASDERAELARTIHSVLERESGPERVRAAMAAPRGYDEKLWSVLCEQVGVAALAIPERYDGFGAGIRELQAVAEELGRGVTPSPLLGSTIAAQALLRSGDDDACSRLLPGLAAGSQIATLGWVDVSGRWDPRQTAYVARREGSGYVIDGTAHYVLDGDTADVLLVVADCEGELGLYDVDPAAARRAHTASMDGTRRFATVALDDVPARRVGGDVREALASVRDVGCAVLAAEQVGAAAEALALTVAYSKEREQFGRPIGSFQALKHRMADMHVLVEASRSACYAAGDAIDTDSPEAQDAALTAKVYCSEAFETVASEMIQLHGGIAITWEHDAHLYFKRAHSSSQLFGMPHEHLARR